MKTFLLLPLAILAFLAPAWADVPAPKPTVITVTNLAAFPQFKFFYHSDNRKETKPIPDGSPFAVYDEVQLLVQSGSEPAQTWERVKFAYTGSKVAIKIEDVKRDGKTIKVTSKTTTGDLAPNKKSASATSPALLLVSFSSVSTCGLVLLARRRKQA